MRLNNKEKGPEAKKNQFIVGRHGKDLPYLSQDLDQNLTEETIADVIEMADAIADYYISHKEYFPEGVKIFYSAKIRAKQTAFIVKAESVKRGINVELSPSAALQEIYQGEFKIDKQVNNEVYPPLEEAWSAFAEGVRDEKLFYRFGEPQKDEIGKEKYPKLAEYFTKSGENQIEFSIRIYEFLRDFLRLPDNKMYVIVTHQAIASRIQRIINALEKISEDQLVPGKMFLIGLLEQSQERTGLGFAESVVVNPSNRGKMASLLEREVSYLKRLSALMIANDKKNDNLPG